jgi:hypothetical protein
MAGVKRKAHWVSAFDSDLENPAKKPRVGDAPSHDPVVDNRPQYLYSVLGEKHQCDDTGITDFLDLDDIAISSLVLREVGHFIRQDAAQETLNTRQDEGIHQVVNPAIPSSPLESWQSFASSTDEQSCRTPETWNGHGPQIQQDLKTLNDISNYLPVNPLLIDSSLIAWAIS